VKPGACSTVMQALVEHGECAPAGSSITQPECTREMDAVESAQFISFHSLAGKPDYLRCQLDRQVRPAVGVKSGNSFAVPARGGKPAALQACESSTSLGIRYHANGYRRGSPQSVLNSHGVYLRDVELDQRRRI
jgi:hypothetical protein